MLIGQVIDQVLDLRKVRTLRSENLKLRTDLQHQVSWSVVGYFHCQIN